MINSQSKTSVSRESVQFIQPLESNINLNCYFCTTSEIYSELFGDADSFYLPFTFFFNLRIPYDSMKYVAFIFFCSIHLLKNLQFRIFTIYLLSLNYLVLIVYHSISIQIFFFLFKIKLEKLKVLVQNFQSNFIFSFNFHSHCFVLIILYF